MARDLSYIVANKIAHRGLHDRAKGVIENTPSAFGAAMARGFAFECDVQLTADGEAVVFHDFVLDRLTHSTGKVVNHTAAQLKTLTMRDTADRIGTAADMFTQVAGKTLIVCEIKSAYNGDMRLTNRIAELVRHYGGPIVIKSFDPKIVAHWHSLNTGIPVGIVAMNHYNYPDYETCTAEEKHAFANLLHFPISKPDFVSWRVQDLPSGVPFLCWKGLGLPLMTWTVKTPADVKTAAAHADQMVFEGFVPE